MHSVRKYLWNLLVNGVLASAVVPDRLRSPLLRAAGITVGRGATIRHHVNITSRHVTIGDGSYIQHGVTLHNIAPILIGRNVALAPNVTVTNVGHDYSNPARRQGAVVSMPTTIGDGAWLGVAATVATGVMIGEGAVVGAGSVVTRNVPAHSLVAGVPARLIRELRSE